MSVEYRRYDERSSGNPCWFRVLVAVAQQPEAEEFGSLVDPLVLFDDFLQAAQRTMQPHFSNRPGLHGGRAQGHQRATPADRIGESVGKHAHWNSHQRAA